MSNHNLIIGCCQRVASRAIIQTTDVRFAELLKAKARVYNLLQGLFNHKPAVSGIDLLSSGKTDGLLCECVCIYVCIYKKEKGALWGLGGWLNERCTHDKFPH